MPRLAKKYCQYIQPVYKTIRETDNKIFIKKIRKALVDHLIMD